MWQEHATVNTQDSPSMNDILLSFIPFLLWGRRYGWATSLLRLIPIWTMIRWKFEKRAGKTTMEAAHSNHPTPLGIKAMNNNTNKRVRGCNNRIVIKQTSNKTNGTCRSTVHQWISLNIGSNRHGKLKVCWKIRFDTQIIPFDMNWVLITFHQQVVSPSLQILYKGMETNNYDVQFFNLVHIITVINWIGTLDN